MHARSLLTFAKLKLADMPMASLAAHMWMLNLFGPDCAQHVHSLLWVLTGVQHRSLQSSARKSTRDLIGSLRQQAGLPPAEPQLPQPQAPASILATQAAGNSGQPVLTTGQSLQQERLTFMPQAAPSIATLVQQPLSASNPAYDLSVESSEVHTVKEQPQMAMLTTQVSSMGQPVLPQTGLMELVSNPLYARSLEVSRTTSTSPVRLDSCAVGKQAEPEAAAQVSDLPADSQTPHPILSAQPTLSAQPILSTDADTQASVSAASEEQMAAQGSADLRFKAAEQTDVTVMPVDGVHGVPEGQTDPAVLHVSDQPILSFEAAPVAVAASLEIAESQGQAAESFEAAAPEQMSDQPILPPADAMPLPATDSTLAMLSDHAGEPGVAVVTTDSGNTIAVSDQPILDENHASQPGAVVSTVVSTDSRKTIPMSDQLILETAPQAVTANPVPVTTSQPLLGPVITQAAEPALPPVATQRASFSTALVSSEQLQSSQQPAQLNGLIETAPAISSQPLLSHEAPSTQASPVVHQVEVTQEAPLPGSGSTHVYTESLTGSQLASQAAVSSSQISTEPQGSMLLPPMPALPSIRRSRSDVRFSQQGQPGAVRRSVSILPPTLETVQPISAPLRSSPVPQLRRSVTSLPASPVPQVPRATPAAPQAVPQQAPLMMPPAYMQQMPLGPLQEGISMPAQQQAVTSSVIQPQSPATVVPFAAPAVSQALGLPVDVQQVELIDTSSAHQSPEPSSAMIYVEQQQQQVQLAVLQESRSLQLSPQQPEGAVAIISQDAPAYMQSFSPVPAVIRQQTEPAPQLIQLLEASSPQQQNAPVFMRNPDAGSSQSLRTHPDPRGAYPTYSPRLMRTNTWSPSPNILQPALPGPAAPAQQVQGPLSMGYQPSWNNPMPPPPSPQAVPLPVARPLERDYAYSSAVPTSSKPVQQPYAYERSMPMLQPEQNVVYERSMPMTSAAAGAVYAVNSRAYPLVASAPLASYSQEAYLAPTSMAMHEQPGPLSGGLARQASPSHPQLRQQMSMSSRTVPVSLAQGSVIQPLQGTVIVGEQSTAIATEPSRIQSQGYSIQPINPGQTVVQSTRGINPELLQASPSRQQQYGAPRQAGGWIAKRILQDFGRSSRSSFNAGASVNSSYQSDRSLQQVMQAILKLSEKEV